MSMQQCLENLSGFAKHRKIQGRKKDVFYNVNLQNEQDKTNKSHGIEIQKPKTPTNNT